MTHLLRLRKPQNISFMAYFYNQWKPAVLCPFRCFSLFRFVFFVCGALFMLVVAQSDVHGQSVSQQNNAAKTQKVLFDVFLQGKIRLGEVGFSAAETNNAYAIKGQAASSGLARAFIKNFYELRAKGTVVRKRNGSAALSSYRPLEYQFDVLKQGTLEYERELTYEKGMISSFKENPPPEDERTLLDFAAFQNHIDPLTAGYIALRDIDNPRMQCEAKTIPISDGTFAAVIELTRYDTVPNKNESDDIVCQGQYKRFNAEQDVTQAFAFNLVYRKTQKGGQTPDLWHVISLIVDTNIGKVEFSRRKTRRKTP